MSFERGQGLDFLLGFLSVKTSCFFFHSGVICNLCLTWLDNTSTNMFLKYNLAVKVSVLTDHKKSDMNAGLVCLAEPTSPPDGYFYMSQWHRLSSRATLDFTY